MTPGTKLGSYEILSQIGAGGMGEVYRAHDPKLGRDVAIKVLPEAFARDAARMARFQREAKVLASLDHPNIASIYGLEDSDGTRALVMQLVEGPTLADRIKAGPIPVDEAVRIARQIADALEYAHERGIIHRDLKPANVKISRDDTVKILDFGLAKALEDEAAPLDISTSPTLSRLATMQGVLLGTAAYMSPEQAKGKPVDRRADIWAFGCVLYEMLAGKMAFHGDSVTDTLAAVIRGDPDWSLLPAATPPHVRVLLRRCLQKDGRQRLRDIGDARIALEEVVSGTAPQLAAPVTRLWRRVLPWAAAILAAIVACLGTWVLKPSPARPVTRTVINLPPGDQLAALDYPAIAISPDGTELAYVAIHSGTRQILLRALDSLVARPLAGTEGANTPFFSPDGQWLGFFAGGKLKKISVSEGAVVTIANGTGSPEGGAWSSNGTIALSPGITTVLQQVSEAGGTARPLARFDKGEFSHRWPDFLPGGEAVLFATSGPNPQIAIQSLRSGERRNVVPGGTSARYATSGHLLYVQGGNLMAAAFDARRLQISGSAVPVVEGILQLPSGGPQFSVSATGSLVYVPGGAQTAVKRLVWVSRNGTEQALPAPPHDYSFPQLSVDRRRLAISVAEQGLQIWLYDLARDTLTRLTFGGNINTGATWTPDGRHVAFTSTKDGPPNVFWQLADGSGAPERLTTSEYVTVPRSFSPDGQLLAYIELNPTTGADIWVLRLSDRKAQPFLRTEFNENAPAFSPEGRWMAYVSDESGRYEVYVQPYPGPGGKYQISTEGGTEPVWNPKGKELFYRSGDKMMAVDVTTQPSFSVGKPRMLFQGPYAPTNTTQPNYDVSPDGQRFLMVKPAEQTASSPLTQIVVVQNWFEELKRLVPTEK
jgi:serine/threonine-protein kinase